MKSSELVLKVTCDCGKGKVVLDSTYFDTSVMTCTVCDIKKEVNCYYVDELLDFNEYLNSLTEEVIFLNNNGKWIKNHEDNFISKETFYEMIKGYTSICEIECEEKIIYYRKNLEFLKLEYNPVHNWYKVLKFLADESKITNLLNYFNNK